MAILVQYRVKANCAAENEQFIGRVFEALSREKPSGIRYASFKAPDGVSFTHFAVVDTDDGKNPLLALEAFKAFASKIRERCETPPQTTELVEVGTYRMFDGGSTRSA
ncbi:MAG: hypothetical protein ACKV2T_15650 [Kofleriaceae bacterium]